MKLMVQALAVLVVAVPAAFAEEAVPSAADAALPAAVEEMPEPATEVLPEASPEMPTATDVAPPADMDMDTADASFPEPAAEPSEDATIWPEATQVEAEEATGETLEPLAALPADELAPPAAPAPSDPLAEPALETHPPLGAIGYDSEGRRGRIHIVVRGDTLWHISDAYLGTPWVWPSIWNDNGEIENPHLIHPGDRIWITPSEMRRISAEEADLMLSNLPPEDVPAAQEELFMEPEPEPAAPAIVPEPVERGSVRVSSRETAGLITPSQLDASASIVGRVPERVLLAQEDDVYIGLGESDVELGDQLTVFRTHEKVFDPDSGVLLGYHVEFLGWIEVEEAYPETARAEIRMSTGELQEGDRVMPREPLPPEIPLQASPAGVEGKISFFPQSRVVIGYNDFVYLNRGTIDGLEVGSPLDVYRPGYAAEETARRDQVLVPDFVVGHMVVVRAEAESSVALVTNSKTELSLGDRFRGADE